MAEKKSESRVAEPTLPEIEVVEPEEEPVVHEEVEHRLLDVPYDGEPYELDEEGNRKPKEKKQAAARKAGSK